MHRAARPREPEMMGPESKAGPGPSTGGPPIKLVCDLRYELTPQQQAVQNEVRTFARETLAPDADRINLEGEYPAKAVAELGRLGYMGVSVPRELGGKGLDHVCYAVAIEEISRICASTGVIMSVNNSLVCNPLLHYGTDEQKKKWLPPLASGARLGAFALTEPSAGTDVAAGQTTAVLDGDSYVINGSKTFITNGTKAQTFLVFALTDRAAKAKGMSVFIVDRATSGFDANPIATKLGIHGSPTADLAFDNMRVPAANLLGKLGDGFKIAMNTLDGGRIGIAAQALGISQASCDAAISYVKGPAAAVLGKRQDVQYAISDMAVRTDAARLLVYRAAWTKDTKERFSEEAAMAKLFAAEAAVRCAADAFNIMGTEANLERNRVERFLRDAKITEIYEGTSEVQRMVISSARLR